MNDKKENPEEPSETITNESLPNKKIKTQNPASEVNLLEDLDQTSQSTIPKNPQDQTVISEHSQDILVNPSAYKDNQKRSKRKEKSNSISVGEVLKNEYISDPAAYVDTYQELKYKDYIYKLNDNLLIRNESDSNNDFVCKLTRIIRPVNLDSTKALAFLEVQWYYKKNDLPKKFAANLNFISENEIFLTNQKDFVMVDCINGLGQVLSYDEYDSLSKILPNTYYSRGKYDINQKRVYPPFEKWAKHCICRTPLNPDYMYIQCDQCNMWFHIECLKLSTEEAQDMDGYTCTNCQRKQNETNPEEKQKLNENINENPGIEGETHMPLRERADTLNEAHSPPTSTSETKSPLNNEKVNETGKKEKIDKKEHENIAN